MRCFVIPRALVADALTELEEALPTPLPGETVPQALDRSLSSGPITDPEREIALGQKLAGSLFPYPLAVELNALVERGIRSHVRIQPSPSTALVPWEGLRVDEGERFVHNSDVSLLPPSTIRNALQRHVAPWDPAGRVVCVLDPAVPGLGGALGPVLGPIGSDSVLSRMMKDLEGRAVVAPSGSAATPLFQRADITRRELETMLIGASRLLYVGHVTTAEHSLDARMHLSCGPDTTGHAALTGRHRPLTAADLVYGHRLGSPQGWSMPNRVAIIGCESGGDIRFAEPAGLVSAAVYAGAQYVTAARWLLPTDIGIRTFAPHADEHIRVLPDAVVAVNHAHEADNPVATLNAWQRKQADQWENTGKLEYSPVIWAALATTFA